MRENDYVYMDSLKIEDIPWIRLATPYGRAEKFPKYFENLQSYDKEAVDNALQQIKWNVEHQDSLWPVTPVALVFLVREFAKIADKDNIDGLSVYIQDKMLDIFISVVKCYHWFKNDILGEEAENIRVLSTFADMLSEDVLWPEVPEDYDEEVDVERYEDEWFSKEVEYSFYYYSYVVLKRIKNLSDKIKNEELKTKFEKLEKLLD